MDTHTRSLSSSPSPVLHQIRPEHALIEYSTVERGRVSKQAGNCPIVKSLSSFLLPHPARPTRAHAHAYPPDPILSLHLELATTSINWTTRIVRHTCVFSALWAGFSSPPPPTPCSP